MPLSPTDNVDILVFNGNHEPGSAKRIDAVNVEQGWTPEQRFGQKDLNKLKLSDRFGQIDLNEQKLSNIFGQRYLLNRSEQTNICRQIWSNKSVQTQII